LAITGTTPAFAEAKPPPSIDPSGLTRVVLKTASILPEVAAQYLVDAAGLRVLTADEDPAVGRGRVVVGGAWGVVLELRGGGDEPDEENGEIPELRGVASAPRLTNLVIASDNPARMRNNALRNGGTTLTSGPAAGERCAGDAYAGCAVNLVGLPIIFVKSSIAKGSPAIARVGVEARAFGGSPDGGTASSADDSADALIARALESLGEGTFALTASNSFRGGDGKNARNATLTQPGLTERAAEDRPFATGANGTVLVPSTAGTGGAVAFGGAWRGSDAWRVLTLETRDKKYAPK
jgi:hypothetical protein